MKRSSKIAGMICFLGFSLLFLTSLSQGQWYPFPMGSNLSFYGFPGNGYRPLAPNQPYYYGPSYGWNQPYNFDGYSYFPNYGGQPSKSYDSYYPPASSNVYNVYYPPTSFQRAKWSDDYFPYRGNQTMELRAVSVITASPPFLKFDGTDIIMPCSSDDQDILNPESPLYYLNPLSPYYGWTPPKRFY